MFGSKMAVFTPRKRRGFFLSSSSSSSTKLSSKFSSSLSDIPTTSSAAGDLLRVGGDWRNYCFWRRGGQTYWVQEEEEEGSGKNNNCRGTDKGRTDVRGKGGGNCKGIYGRREVVGSGERGGKVVGSERGKGRYFVEGGDERDKEGSNCKGIYGRRDVVGSERSEKVPGSERGKGRYYVEGRERGEGRDNDCNETRRRGYNITRSAGVAKRDDECNGIQRRNVARSETVEKVDCNEIQMRSADVAEKEGIARRGDDHRDTRDRTIRDDKEGNKWRGDREGNWKRDDDNYDGIAITTMMMEKKIIDKDGGKKERPRGFCQIVEEEEEDNEGRIGGEGSKGGITAEDKERKGGNDRREGRRSRGEEIGGGENRREGGRGDEGGVRYRRREEGRGDEEEVEREEGERREGVRNRRREGGRGDEEEVERESGERREGVRNRRREGGRGDEEEVERESGERRDGREGEGNCIPILTQTEQFPVRDRSRVGVRSSLPFSVAPSSSSFASSGHSSGSSDTQSQGSGGGDSKSDSPTPEGTRKNTESSSSSSSSSSGVVAGVSVRCGKGHELPAVTAGARESAALRQEVETLRAEITKARQTILHMQEREKKLKDRLGDRASRGVERGSGRIENLSLGERRPSALVRRYGNLYAQARVDTLDALDILPDLKNAEELKSKLLFSVVVLAFRSASSSAQALREEVRRVLQVPPPPPPSDPHPAYDPHSHALELGVSSFVTANIDKHDLSKNVEEVCQQIWATLYDYPSLKVCDGLLQYVKDCVRLAWGLCNQTPPYVIDYETRTYRKDSHVRFHTADPEKEMIKTYLWPALLEGHGGPCVQKGVVVT